MENTDKKEFASIYHDIEGLTSFVQCIEEATNDTELKYNLELIEKRLSHCKAYMIETVVKDVMGAYAPIAKIDRNQKDITLEQAVKLIEKVKKQAHTLSMSVVIAIFNSAARPVAIECMDDSYIASFDVAINKAYTSASLKMSTLQLKSFSQPGGSLYGIQNTNDGKIVIFGGGEPLIINGKIIGAIGVSGGTEDQDSALAKFGKDMLEEGV